MSATVTKKMIPFLLSVFCVCSTLADDPLIECNSQCHHHDIALSFYSTPTEQNLLRKHSLCNVTSPQPRTAAVPSQCQLDLYKSLRVVENGSDTVVLYNIIHCADTDTRVMFTNNAKIINKKVIGYLHVVNCQVYWSDIAFYAETVDLRVLTLENWTDTLDKDRQNFQNLSTHLSNGLYLVPKSLQTVGTMHISRTAPDKYFSEDFPKVLMEYVWPVMAEVLLENMSVTAIPDVLQFSLPILQSLELPFNNITEPHIFPWHNDALYLPRNLSRAFNFNHHYSISEGFQIAANLYRRVLVLRHCAISSLDHYTFTGCLQKISLSSNAISSFSVQTFNSVTCLQRLDLSGNRIKQFPEKAFHNLVNLITLDLSYNNLEMSLRRDHFTGLVKLQEVDLSHNKITTIEDFTFFSLESIAEINLADNLLQEVPRHAVDSESKNLLTVSFDSNNMSSIPHWVFLVRNLQDINFNNNGLNLEKFMNSIKDIDLPHLTFNNYWGREEYRFIIRPALTKHILLRNNLFHTLDMKTANARTQTILGYVLLFFNVDLSENNLHCDCHTYSMRDYLLRLFAASNGVDSYNSYAQDNWRCSAPASLSGKLLTQVPAHQFKCEEPHLQDCPKQCICYSRAVDNVLEVDCSRKAMRNVPQVVPQNTQILNMAANILDVLEFPPSYMANLTKVDFSHNNLSQISNHFVSTFRKGSAISLHHNRLSSLPKAMENLQLAETYLAYNRWVCDCHAVWFKQWLLMNRHAVQDIDTVFCSSGKAHGTEIIVVQEQDFICELPISVTIIKYAAVVIALIVLALTTFFTVYCKRGQIKLFLYVHFKWHPFDQSEINDQDHLYDAFVSYAGDDYKWVVFRLVARLEGLVPPFKLCVHDRDFQIGAPIQENICNAIKHSRRMIIFLTRNYLRSEWCLHEFREAHEKVLRNCSNYIIMVLFEDDISIEEVPDDMKLYLRTNTYLSVKNKWFWEKLEYAMPKEALCTLRKDVTFDFPCLTEPPKEYPEYMNNYISHTKKETQIRGANKNEKMEKSVERCTIRQECTDDKAKQMKRTDGRCKIRQQCTDKSLPSVTANDVEKSTVADMNNNGEIDLIAGVCYVSLDVEDNKCMNRPQARQKQDFDSAEAVT